MNAIRFNSYTTGYEWLSNFSPHSVVDSMGVLFPTVEHAYQAAKTLDETARERIRAAGSPSIAKRIGKQILLRDDWELTKVPTMKFLVLKKFTTHEDLGRRLVATRNAELCHLAPWDTFWGVNNAGRGQNMLGMILMEVRTMLK